MVQYAYYDSPFQTVKIGYENDAVVFLKCVSEAGSDPAPSAVSDFAMEQLREYFAGTRKDFTFPIALKGAPFQKAVWQALREIPYGQTRTYGQIAAAAGNPGAARAVGMANNRNPLWIVVPCHRVVGANQSLTGYAGGLEMKQQLLQLEQTNRFRF